MDRGEPTLAPEWLKSAAGSSSSHPDDHNNGSLSRSRLAVSICDRDVPRASSSSSSSFRRSVGSNGSTGHEKDRYTQSSRAYSSFGRSHRDRDRDRSRDRQRDREKASLLGNGYRDFGDSLMARRAEKGLLSQSHSMVSGRLAESLPKRPGRDSVNGVVSMGSLSAGLGKGSFDKNFPSLGAEEKHGVSEVGRMASSGISTAFNSLHISTPAIIGADGWTSALAEVPAVGVSNGSSMSTSLQTATSMGSSATSTSSGLSMAEALVQASSRSRTAPLLADENERRKELTLMQQYNKLIPVLNCSEKSKNKGTRNGELVSPRVVQQPSSQLANHALRLPSNKPEILKTSQGGNFLVLNREKNGCSPTAKDAMLLTPANRVASHGGATGATSELSPHLKSPANQKLKTNGVGEKKPPFQAQEKYNFFNALRKQAEMKNGVSQEHPDLVSSGASLSSSKSLASNSVMKSDKQFMESQKINLLATEGSGIESSVAVNGNDSAYDEEPETLVAPDEEEKAFLESLGWNENAGEDALTAEEIESFVKKHEEKLGPDFKYKAGLPESRRSGSCSSGLSLSSTESEM